MRKMQSSHTNIIFLCNIGLCFMNHRPDLKSVGTQEGRMLRQGATCMGRLHRQNYLY